MKRFERIIGRLTEFNVDFVIVGGLGALLHGGSMMTQDVDVACRMEPDNLRKLFAALEELHPVHRLASGRRPFTREDAGRGDWKNIYLTTDWGQLDCLGEIKGVGDFARCRAAGQTFKIDGGEVCVLALDSLIAAKRAIGRPRDLQAVLELEAARARRQAAQ